VQSFTGDAEKIERERLLLSRDSINMTDVESSDACYKSVVELLKLRKDKKSNYIQILLNGSESHFHAQGVAGTEFANLCKVIEGLPSPPQPSNPKKIGKTALYVIEQKAVKDFFKTKKYYRKDKYQYLFSSLKFQTEEDEEPVALSLVGFIVHMILKAFNNERNSLLKEKKQNQFNQLKAAEIAVVDSLKKDVEEQKERYTWLKYIFPPARIISVLSILETTRCIDKDTNKRTQAWNSLQQDYSQCVQALDGELRKNTGADRQSVQSNIEKLVAYQCYFSGIKSVAELAPFIPADVQLTIPAHFRENPRFTTMFTAAMERNTSVESLLANVSDALSAIIMIQATFGKSRKEFVDALKDVFCDEDNNMTLLCSLNSNEGADTNYFNSQDDLKLLQSVLCAGTNNKGKNVTKVTINAMAVKLAQLALILEGGTKTEILDLVKNDSDIVFKLLHECCVMLIDYPNLYCPPISDSNKGKKKKKLLKERSAFPHSNLIDNWEDQSSLCRLKLKMLYFILNFNEYWDLQQRHSKMGTKPSEATITTLEELIQCNVPALWLRSSFAKTNSKKTKSSNDSDDDMLSSEEDAANVVLHDRESCTDLYDEGMNNVIAKTIVDVLPPVVTKVGRCVINRHYRNQLDKVSLEDFLDSVTSLEEYKRYLDLRVRRKQLSSVPYLYSMSSSPSTDHLPLQSQFVNATLEVNGESVATDTVFCKGDRIEYPVTYYVTAHSKKTVEETLAGTVICGNTGEKTGTYVVQFDDGDVFTDCVWTYMSPLDDNSSDVLQRLALCFNLPVAATTTADSKRECVEKLVRIMKSYQAIQGASSINKTDVATGTDHQCITENKNKENISSFANNESKKRKRKCEDYDSDFDGNVSVNNSDDDSTDDVATIKGGISKKTKI
jgi:uncharacterized protein (DUF427 family)